MRTITRDLLVVLAIAAGLPVFAQAAAPVDPSASPAGDVPPLDLTDTDKLWQQLNAMSADDLARYLTDSKSLAVRLAVAKAIQKIGPEVRTEAVEKALNAALADDDLRIDAAVALVAIGASAKAAVPGLMKDLESGEIVPMRSMISRYRCGAAVVLATIPEAGPALLEGLSSDKEIVRLGCLFVLAKRANFEGIELRIHQYCVRLDW